MPLYDYICNNDDCKTDTFEVLSSYEEKEIATCPVCGENSKDRKKFYQFAFRL